MKSLFSPKRQGQIPWKWLGMWPLACLAGWAGMTSWGVVAAGVAIGLWTPPPMLGDDTATALCQVVPAAAPPAPSAKPESLAKPDSMSPGPKPASAAAIRPPQKALPTALFPPAPKSSPAESIPQHPHLSSSEAMPPAPKSSPAESIPPRPQSSPAEAIPPTPEAPEPPQPPETTQTLQKLFHLFLEKPTKENYLQVLDALCRHPAYDPYSHELEEVAHLLEQRRYEEAKAKLDAAMPNLLLSPRAHNYYRVIAEAAGDTQEAQRRDQIAQKCLQGIQATGQGMVDVAGGEPKQDQLPAAPFQVARVSDEYDLLRALGKRARVLSQSLRRINDRWYDVLRCSDEAGNVFHVWFDVTRPMAALRRHIQQSSEQEKTP
jgi:hypothetical protein